MELTTTDLAVLERLGERERWLVVLATTRPDTSIQMSVVNAGLIHHPLSGERVVGIVARGGTVKLRNLRLRPTADSSSWPVTRPATFGLTVCSSPRLPPRFTVGTSRSVWR